METNNIPNPIVPQSTPVQPVSPAHKHHWAYFAGALIIIFAAAGIIWWQLNEQIKDTQSSLPVIVPDADTQEFNKMSNDLQRVQDANLGNEFQQIDKDLDSL